MTQLDDSIGMQLVGIEPGTFLMGSPENEAGHSNEETLHRVTLTRPFLMQTTAVTQAQWQAVMGTNVEQQQAKAGQSGRMYGVGGSFPMYYVSWYEANDFCRILGTKEGRRYRLPTEAEWEHACRAGTAGPYAGGSLDELGWYADNSSSSRIDSAAMWKQDMDKYWQRIDDAGCQAHPVAGKRPNPWGLYDTHGNVWEWCSDVFSSYSGDATDPAGPECDEDHPSRVVRGGSWRYGPDYCRSAYRSLGGPGLRNKDIGFRIVREA